MNGLQFHRAMGKFLFILLAFAGMMTQSANALTVASLYPDCKKTLVFMDGIAGGKKMKEQKRAVYFASFLRCSGYINGALEMKRMINLTAHEKGPYCSPKGHSLNLTVAVRLFVGFVEAGKKTKSQVPAAAVLVGALRSVLALDGALAKKHGCFPDK